jgi:hypothetical protein
MQSFPAGIHSGMDYYLNDAGLLICETTIGQTRFDGKGVPLASRIRAAMQYADNIDKAVAILEKGNNGLYTNEWLLGDIKTNEIAMLELGTHKTRLRRSSKNEWFGDTKGFYWGCNNTKDLAVRLETVPSTSARPRGAVFVPTDRDKKWLQLYDKYKGKIDADFGKLAFTTAPLAAFPSIDAKFTTSDMAKRLESWALFGPPLGRSWQPTFAERTDFPEVRPLVSNPWTVLTGAPPDRSKGDGIKVVDRHNPNGSKLPEFSRDPKEPALHTMTAWRGTLLPKNDIDVWLASAFSAYERYVAMEKALLDKAGKKGLNAADRDKLAVALFGYRSMYEHGARSRQEPSLAKVRRDLRQRWHKVALGKGVLLLHALRNQVGAEAFDRMMDDFGTANAGKEVSTEQFTRCAEKAAGKSLAAFFTAWLTRTGLPAASDEDKSGKVSWRSRGPFSVFTFYSDVERTMIVYGTRDEEAANREAARELRKALLRRWANVEVPIRSDRTVTAEELASHHLLLVGRPATNSISERFKDSLPVTFGSGSAVVRKEAYANADTAVVAAAENPKDRRSSLVVIAGLGAAATVRAVSSFSDRDLPAGEVVILQYGKVPHALVVPPEKP